MSRSFAKHCTDDKKLGAKGGTEAVTTRLRVSLKRWRASLGLFVKRRYDMVAGDVVVVPRNDLPHTIVDDGYPSARRMVGGRCGTGVPLYAWCVTWHCVACREPLTPDANHQIRRAPYSQNRSWAFCVLCRTARTGPGHSAYRDRMAVT